MYKLETLAQSEWAGIENMPGLAAMVKALEAGTGVDAGLPFTGGRALGYESLDPMLQFITLTERHASLWRAIRKRPLHATIDQYNVLSSEGSEWGGAVAESSNPVSDDPDIARAYAGVKFYRRLRSVSDVSMLVSTTDSPMQVQQQSATSQLIKNLDRDMYIGDSNVFPKRIQGLIPAIVAYASPIIHNMAGTCISGREHFPEIAAEVANNGGVSTHAFMNPLLGADISNVYESAERIVLRWREGNPGKQEVFAGATIGGVATAQGDIAFEQDPFLRVGWKAPSVAEGTTPTAPASVTGSAGGSGNSLPAGDYFYKVTAVYEDGQSVTTAPSGAITVGAGEKVTLTITRGATTQTGFWIYRSAKNATTDADCRWLWHVAYSGSSTTSFVDDGTWVPGTCHVPVIDMRNEDHACALQWSQLMPMTMKKLAQTGPTQPFLMNLYGVMRIVAPQWFGLITNVLPKSVRDAGWNPLGTA